MAQLTLTERVAPDAARAWERDHARLPRCERRSLFPDGADLPLFTQAHQTDAARPATECYLCEANKNHTMATHDEIIHRWRRPAAVHGTEAGTDQPALPWDEDFPRLADPLWYARFYADSYMRYIHGGLNRFTTSPVAEWDRKAAGWRLVWWTGAQVRQVVASYNAAGQRQSITSTQEA